MGNVEGCDKTLPTNEMMFHVRRDAALRSGTGMVAWNDVAAEER
jgi:hypothetical protein